MNGFCVVVMSTASGDLRLFTSPYGGILAARSRGGSSGGVIGDRRILAGGAWNGKETSEGPQESSPYVVPLIGLGGGSDTTSPQLAPRGDGGNKLEWGGCSWLLLLRIGLVLDTRLRIALRGFFGPALWALTALRLMCGLHGTESLCWCMT